MTMSIRRERVMQQKVASRVVLMKGSQMWSQDPASAEAEGPRSPSSRSTSGQTRSPTCEGDVAILEDRAHRDRELLAAGSRVALEETRTGAVAVESSYGGLAAVGADGAIGP